VGLNRKTARCNVVEAKEKGSETGGKITLGRKRRKITAFACGTHLYEKSFLLNIAGMFENGIALRRP